VAQQAWRGGEEVVSLRLTEEQRLACREIGSAVTGRRAEIFLLHGVTGSGKTEVYLRAVAESLRIGRQALVLVPEITLTHQIVSRLRARFGDRLAVLHSGLRPSERLGQWERLRRGRTPIAVGARSALFAPIEELGVIVIDEEHDSPQEREDSATTHTACAWRAHAASCPPCRLGHAGARDHGRRAERSAAPPETDRRPAASVELVDGRERALLPRGRKLILSSALLRAMR
jgi:primosomal protein N' (replication factor Y)